MYNNTDVLIIGGGMTGTVAAYELVKAGLKVRMLRNGLGASPGISGFNICGVQQGDNVDVFIKDTVVSGRNQGDKKLVDELCNGSLTIQKYLEDLGFEFDKDENGNLKARKSLGSSYGRVVGQGNHTGAKVLSILHELLAKDENFEVLENLRALRLLKKNDKVNGAYCYDFEEKKFVNLYSKAVLLCSGGFAGIFPFTSNSKDISGDGTAMAYEAGCPLIDMEFVQFEPSSAVWPLQIRGKGMITTLFYEGAIMTNNKGERFMLKYGEDGERVNKDVLSLAIEKELLAGNGSEHGGIFFDASGVDENRLHEAYEPFVKRYADVGINLCKEKVELANAAHTSLGGVKIDEKCHSDIKGLYVAGEAAGHLHGANRIGGSAGSETLIFSRIAAKTIIDDINSLDIEEFNYEPIGGLNEEISLSRLKEIEDLRKDALGSGARVLRNQELLEKAYKTLDDLLDEVKHCAKSVDDEINYKRLALENNLIVSKALVLAAKERKDSCGCHQRSDYPDAPSKNYHIEIIKQLETMKISLNNN